MKNIRGEQQYTDNKEELRTIGFNFNRQINYHGWDKVHAVIKPYKELHGDTKVNSSVQLSIYFCSHLILLLLYSSVFDLI